MIPEPQFQVLDLGGLSLGFLGFGRSSVIDGYDYGEAAPKIREAMRKLERHLDRNGRTQGTGKLEQNIQELKLDKLNEDKLAAEAARQWGKANSIQQVIDRVAAKRFV